MFEIVLVAILTAFIIGGIWAFVVTKKVKEEGIEADALVSRIELHEWSVGAGDLGEHDSVTEDYYITYTNKEGRAVEALLSNPGSHKFKEGDKIRIKSLVNRQDYPVLVKIL